MSTVEELRAAYYTAELNYLEARAAWDAAAEALNKAEREADDADKH